MNKVTRQKRVTRLAALALGVFDQSQDTPVQSKVMNIQSMGKHGGSSVKREILRSPLYF